MNQASASGATPLLLCVAAIETGPEQAARSGGGSVLGALGSKVATVSAQGGRTHVLTLPLLYGLWCMK